MSELVIVDDNRDVKDIYEMAFNRAGIKTVGFTSGEEALNYVKHSPEVKAVVLDLAMSPLDGFSVSELLRVNELTRTNPVPLKIAYFTAFPVDSTVRDFADRMGVSEIFTKPVEPHIFVEKVRQWMKE